MGVSGMWALFFVGSLAFAVSIFLPGYLQLRCLGFRRASSFAFSPLCSISEYAIVGALFGLAGVSVSSFVLYGTVLGASVLLFCLLGLRSRDFKFRFDECFDYRILFLYIAVGVFLGAWLFLRNLDGPASFAQEFDNVFHLNVITAFSSIGRYSIFQATTSPTSISPFSDISFYPAAWHVLVSLLTNALQLQSSIAENIGIFVFISLVYPVSWFAFLTVLFKGSRRPILAGSVVSFSFASFPWGFIAYGPLYSNMASYALLPAALALFMVLFFGKTPRTQRNRLALVFLLSVLSLAFCQTNAIFTAVIMMTPFVAVEIYKSSRPLRSQGVAFGLAICFVAFVAIVLVFSYKAPFLEGVIHNPYRPYTSTVSQGFIDYLDFGYRNSLVQPPLMLALCLGILFSLIKRRYRWLIVSFVYFMFAYVSAGSVTGGILHDFMSGFWYNDVDRIAANATFAAIPLSVLGIELVFELVSTMVVGLTAEQNRRESARSACVFVYLLFCFLVFIPNYIQAGNGEVKTAFGERACRFEELATGDKCLTADEIDFMDKVKEIVGESVVINEPYDGSAFAYATSNLNVAFRSFFLPEGDDDVAIRSHLIDITTDASVSNAVKNYEAKYLIQLDAGDNDNDATRYSHYGKYGSCWSGVDMVNEQTSGFTLVLSEGDKRLYKIDL